MTKGHTIQAKNTTGSQIADILIDLSSNHNMTLRLIADEIGVDEATVSRLKSSKQPGSVQLLKALKMLRNLIVHHPMRWPSEKSKKDAEARATQHNLTVEDFAALCAVRYGAAMNDALTIERAGGSAALNETNSSAIERRIAEEDARQVRLKKGGRSRQ